MHDVPYILSSYLSYEFISPKYQAHLDSFSVNMEPTSYAESINDLRWVEAIQVKISALKSNHTWQVIPPTQGKKPIR